MLDANSGNIKEQKAHHRRTRWLISVSVSIGLMLLLFYLVDLKALCTALHQVDYWLVLLAFIPLTAEALTTAWRIKTCANTHLNYSASIYANAWYVLWLTLLPARLGEVAGISVFNKVLGMKPGSAAASILVQRLFDLVILSSFLLAALSITLLPMEAAKLLVLVSLIAIPVLITSLPGWLSCLARLIYPFKHRHQLISRSLRFSLQARHWCRIHLARSLTLLMLMQTLIKWTANMIAVMLLLYACDLPLDSSSLFLISILLHFLGAIPVQSIGGIGIVEAGLTSLLVYFGTQLDQAVAASLVIRFTALAYSAVFFTSTYFLYNRRGNIRVGPYG